MSGYNDAPQREVDPHQVWQPLVLAAEAGLQLSPEDTRAMQLREACLQLADYFEAVGEGMIDPEDPVANASALAQYYQGYDILRQFGIQEHAQEGRPQQDYRDPSVMAEYFAGQWMCYTDRPARPLKQIRRELQEMAEGKIEDGSTTSYMLSSEHFSPKVQDWVIMRLFVGFVSLNLARELGRPQLPPVERPEDQTNTD